MNLLRRHLLDAFLIAAAVAEFMALAVSDHRMRLLAAAFGAASLLVLLARRRQPLVASIAAFAFLGGSFAAAPDSPNVQFFGTLITFAIVGAINRTRDGIIAGVVGAAVISIIEASTDPGEWAGDLALTLGFCLVMFSAGWLVGRHIRRADLMAERAEVAQAQRQTAVRDERARIARELHDVVSHGLSVVVLQTIASRTSLVDGDSPSVERHLDAVETSAREALADMRRMLGLLQVDDLAGDVTTPAPGLAQLPGLIARAQQAGVNVEVAELIPDAPTEALTPGVELAAYRVVQEALTNAAKHAPAARVSVRVFWEPGVIAVRIDDDGGPGRPGPALGGAGRGLIGMRERVALYGGTITAEPASGGWVRGRRPDPDRTGRRLATLGHAVISVLLADDQALVRDGFRSIIDHEPDLRVVAEACDGVEAIAMVSDRRPDVVLMDIRMPRIDGLAATRAILARPDPPRVLVLTTFDRNEWVYEALRAGASGFLLKDVRARQLTDAIRTVASGESLLAPSITRRLIEAFVRTGGATVDPTASMALTDREIEVVRLIGAGLSNAEIADRLVVGLSTVKTHVNRMLTKLALRDRTQLVIYAYDHGVLRPGG